MADEVGQLVFRVNRDSLRVQRTRQNARIRSPLQIRDLGGGERYNLIVRTLAEVLVEVVEVASPGPQDDNPSAGCRRARARGGTRVPRSAWMRFELRHGEYWAPSSVRFQTNL